MTLQTTFVVGLLLLATTKGQVIDPEQFRKINLPAGYEPTSSVSIAVSTDNLADIFYRGEQLQLLHVIMSDDGKIVAQNDLGGILLTAPSVISQRSGQLDVAYVTTDQQVVIRSFRKGSWGVAQRLGVRSEFAPTLVAVSETTMTVLVTRISLQVVSRTRTKNCWGTFMNEGISAIGSAAVAEGQIGLEAKVFVRDIGNNVVVRSVSGGGAWEKVSGGLRFYSDMCAMYYAEAILGVFGRDAESGVSLMGRLYLTTKWFQQKTVTSPWISEAPACLVAFNGACSDIIVNQGSSLYRRQYCS